MPSALSRAWWAAEDQQETFQNQKGRLKKDDVFIFITIFKQTVISMVAQLESPHPSSSYPILFLEIFAEPWKWGHKPNLSCVVLCKSSHGGGVGSRILSQAGGDLDHISGALLRDHHRVVERCREILLRLQCERWALRLKDTHRDPAWFETSFLLECG